MPRADRPRSCRAPPRGECFVIRYCGEQGGAAEKRRQRVGHDKGRYCCEIGLKTALRLEAFAKRRLDKSLTELRDDAAADIDAAAGTEGQRQIAGHRAEHRAEHRRGLDAERVLRAHRQIGDLGGRVTTRRDAVELRQGIVEIDEPGSRQGPLGGDVVEMPAHTVEDRALAIGGRRHRRMPALPGQRDPAVPDGTRPETPRPDPGPSTPIGVPATAAPPPTASRSSGVESRKSQRQRGEIVDDLEPLEAEPVFQRPGSKRSRDDWSSRRGRR